MQRVRGRRSRIEQAGFCAHEGSMTLCFRKAQGVVVVAFVARALHGGGARGCSARALGFADAGCASCSFVSRAALGT